MYRKIRQRKTLLLPQPGRIPEKSDGRKSGVLLLAGSDVDRYLEEHQSYGNLLAARINVLELGDHVRSQPGLLERLPNLAYRTKLRNNSRGAIVSKMSSRDAATGECGGGGPCRFADPLLYEPQEGGFEGCLSVPQTVFVAALSVTAGRAIPGSSWFFLAILRKFLS
jgi:hypothetical protein